MHTVDPTRDDRSDWEKEMKSEKWAIENADGACVAQRLTFETAQNRVKELNKTVREYLGELYDDTRHGYYVVCSSSK